MNQDSSQGEPWKKTILVVDDTPVSISLVRTSLEGEGYDVSVATSGKKALEIAELVMPDLILLDILMPGMDGYETCRQMKIRENLRDIPIIFLSGLTETFDKVKGFELGAVDYLIKPIAPAELLARVRTHISIIQLEKKLLAANRELEDRVAKRTEELRMINADLQHEIEERILTERKLIVKNEELQRANEQLAATEEELRSNYQMLSLTEQELRESEQRYRNVVEDQTELICRFKRDGTVTFINSAFCRYFNVKEEEIIGNPFFSDIPREDRSRFKDHFRSITPENPVRMIEHRIILLTGEIRWQQWSDRAIFDNAGNIIEYQSVGRDITDRRRAEESLNHALKKLNLLNAVAFNEIQNTVYALTGYIDLQNEPVSEEDRIEYYQSEKRLLHKILDSLEFAKMYQDLGIKPPKWLNVSQLFIYAISHLDVSHITRHVNVDNLEIFVDPLFEQVLFILADNMLQHGERVTECSLGYIENQEGLVIFFEDNGKGIPDDKKKSILKKEYLMGKRIGLFLAQEILEITGLLIKETGIYGKGARFEIFVPKGGYRFGG